jgi:AbrB family looped-hinge helix DNA binding protein
LIQRFLEDVHYMDLLGDSKITGKYQVTIPKAVREILELENGDLLVFVREQNAILVKRGKVSIEK